MRNVDVIMKEVKVLICSAQRNVLEYFSGVLNSRDIKVTGMAVNYAAAAEAMHAHSPMFLLQTV